MDLTFNDTEKRFVLAEIIKASSVDWKYIRDFLKMHQVRPDWFSIQLPPGRNMTQCIGAVEAMLETPIPIPAVPQLATGPKRKSGSDLTLSEPSQKRQAIASPLEPHPSFGSMSRSFGPGPPVPVGIPPPPLHTRPSPNGYSPQPALGSPGVIPPSPSSGPGQGPITSSTPLPSRRKRGRPSKADMEARQRERAPRILGYHPIQPTPPPNTIAPADPIGYAPPPPQHPPPGAGPGAGSEAGSGAPAPGRASPKSGRATRAGQASATVNVPPRQDTAPGGVQGTPPSGASTAGSQPGAGPGAVTPAALRPGQIPPGAPPDPTSAVVARGSTAGKTAEQEREAEADPGEAGGVDSPISVAS